MKTLLALSSAAALLFLSGCAAGGFPPVKGQVCYVDAKGNRVCVGSDGKAIVLEGEFKADAAKP